jgi:hypothetical protein
MKSKSNCSCKFLHKIDLYAKEAELYYKGSNQKSTLIGRIFTILYILMYGSFFLYQIVEMFSRSNVSFNDSYAFTGEPPKIQLNKDIFYGGFALGNPLTLETFVDDSIYNVKAYYRSGIKKGNHWSWTTIPLKIETCKLENFGENYRDIFKDKQIENLHCVTALDQILQGHVSYNTYSFFLIKFFPCINSTENNFSCKPLSVIKSYLTQTFVTFKMEDIDLTPQIYNSPIQLRGKDVTANIESNLFKDVHSFFQVVNIETDEDLIGFGVFSSIRKEKYIKYDESIIFSSLKNYDVFETGDSLCDVTIQLSENELTQKRTYTKLVEVLEEVGGFMEVFYTFFKIISSFLTDTLYEQSLVNNLFNFDIDKKIILIKSKKNTKNQNVFQGEMTKLIIPSKITTISHQNSNFLNEENTFRSKGKLNDSPFLKNRNLNDKYIINTVKKKRRKVINQSTFNKNEKKESANPLNIKNTRKENDNNNKDKFGINIYDMNYNNVNSYKWDSNEGIIHVKGKQNNKKNVKDNNEKKEIYQKIRVNRCCIYLCFLCVRKRKNIQNILLDEGMKIIIEKLDIMNLFKRIYRDEKLQEMQDDKEEYIKMSDECKTKLFDIYNNTLSEF